MKYLRPLDSLFEATKAEDIFHKKTKEGKIPSMWQLEEQLKEEGHIQDNQALTFYCPIYFGGQPMVKALLDVKDEYGQMLLFPLPAIEDEARVKVGLREMKRLGIEKPEQYLSFDDKTKKKALRCYSILPGYEGIASPVKYGFIGYEAVQLASFSIVPKEWVNGGDPYNQTYKFPGEKEYSPYWRIPPFKEFKKLRPDLAKGFDKKTLAKKAD